MRKTTRKKAAKQKAIDPDLTLVLEAKRRLRQVDRLYTDIGRMTRAITRKRALLDEQLRKFSSDTLDRLDREAREWPQPPAVGE